jgi:hypothetical protein
MNWQAIASILAVVLTAVFAWVAYVTRTNNERKRILSSTLFNLLEIWHQIKKLHGYNSAQVSVMYLEEIQKQIPEIEISESDREQVTQFLENNMQIFLTQFVTKGEELLEDSFQQSIKQLAEVEPLLAFSLRANKSIKSAILEIDTFLNKSLDDLVSDDKEKDQADEMLKGMKKYMYEDATHDLEKDLRLLSFKIGFPTYIRTTYLLKRKSKMNKSDMQKLTSKLVSELVIPHIRK